MSNSKKGIIVVDFDGTLGPNPFVADKSKLLMYSRVEKMQAWTEMKPFPNAIPIINTLNCFFDVIILTGRDETARRVSEVWLKAYRFNYYKLQMFPKAWESYDEYLTHKLYEIYSLSPIMVIDDDFDLLSQIAQQIKDIGVYMVSSNQDWRFCKILECMERKEYKWK